MSYQFRKCPWWRCSVSNVSSVASRRASSSDVLIQPKRPAQATLSRYKPMLVGDVRCASMSCGVICRLSGGRWLSAAVTQRSKYFQVSRAMSRRYAWSRADNAASSRVGRFRLTHQTHSAPVAHSRHSASASAGVAVPAISNPAISRSAASGSRQWLRTSGPRRVDALACAVSAVVHCSRSRWLTSIRYKARSSASPASSACASNCVSNHSPPSTARSKSVPAWL